MVHIASNIAPNGETISPADMLSLRQEQARLSSDKAQVAKHSTGEIRLVIGDQFPEGMANATAIFTIIGFMTDGRVGVRLSSLTGALTADQQKWLHVNRCGDLAVWLADSVASRIAARLAA